MHDQTQERRPLERGAGLIAAVLLLLLLWPLVRGEAGPVGDATLFHLPYQMLVGDFARAGELVAWNPWTNGGSPDGAEPQIGAASPLAVAAGLVAGGTSAAFVLFWLGTWCLSALGMARLAARLGAPGWARVALALAWCTNGAFVGHAGHTCFVHAFAFLPWSVWLLDRALDPGSVRTSVRLAAGAGGWWGLSALAGYPGLVVVQALVLGGWALVRLVPGRADESAAASPLGAARALLVLVATGLVVLAPSYAAFFVEGSGFSARTGALPREIATGWGADDPAAANPLETAALFSVFNAAVAPLAADPAHDPFAITDPTSVGTNAGTLVVVLALAALVGARRSRRDALLFALGLVSLGLALGHALPLRAWAYDLLPPLRYFRHAAFFRVGFLFALAVLAARGSRSLEPRRLALVAFCVAALSAATTFGALATLPSLKGAAPPWVWSVAPALPLVVGLVARSGSVAATRTTLAALTIVGAAFALLVGRPLVMESAERRDALDARHDPSLVGGEAGFTRSPFAFTVPDERTDALLAGDVEALAPHFADPVGALFDSANLPGKQNVLAGYTALNNVRHHQLAAFPPLVDQALGRERVFFARRALFLPDDEATFAAWAAASRSGDVPLVVHTAAVPATDLAADDAPTLLAAARLDRVPFEVTRFAPDALDLELLRPREESGWLYVTERWAAGWSAEVTGADGRRRPAPVHRAGFLWRAIEVPAGARAVHMRYRLFGRPWLVLLSWGTLGALVLGSLVSGVRRERAPRADGILAP